MPIDLHETPIPPLATLAASLRRGTEALTSEIEAPTVMAPAWSEFDWGIARAAIAIHGTAGILLRNLRWPAPVEWREFLAAQVAQTREAQTRLTAALAEVDALSREAHIPVTMLKGCALHSVGIYQPGERPMADIDLLVRESDSGAMSGHLQRIGFVLQDSSWKHLEFARGGPPMAVKIDLHTRLSERLASRLIELPGVELVASVGGVRGYASPAAMMRHLLLHSAANMSTRWVRAVHLFDIAQLAARFDSTDWQELRSRDWPDRWVLYPPLLLVSRYFPGKIQVETLEELAAACHPLLARWARLASLSDVSASNPVTMALPELAWCTSAGTLLGYVKTRLFPDRSELDGFRDLARTSEYGRDQRWFTMSQPARLATWLFRRPVRPATVHAVRWGLEWTKPPASSGSLLLGMHR
jgi:hypothetical protein